MAGAYEDIKERLAQISASVQEDDLSLDEALDLYEEAIALASEVSEAAETGVFADGQPAQTVIGGGQA